VPCRRWRALRRLRRLRFAFMVLVATSYFHLLPAALPVAALAAWHSVWGADVCTRHFRSPSRTMTLPLLSDSLVLPAASVLSCARCWDAANTTLRERAKAAVVLAGSRGAGLWEDITIAAYRTGYVLRRCGICLAGLFTPPALFRTTEPARTCVLRSAGFCRQVLLPVTLSTFFPCLLPYTRYLQHINRRTTCLGVPS